MRGLIAQKRADLRAQWARLVADGGAPLVITEPSLVAGKVVTPRIFIGRPPGIPQVELELDAGTVGADSVNVQMTSPSGAHSVQAFYVSLPLYPPQSRHMKFTLQINSPFSSGGFGLYTEAGKWTVQSVSVNSKDGNTVNYNGSELASVFPNATVDIVNRTEDVTPPTVGSGAILTPTVSLSSTSPLFAASLAAADALSGVASVGLTIQPPGTGFPLYAYVNLAAPLLKGTAYPAVSFTTQSVTGTYSITGYSVCDYAGNCVSDNVAADIKKTFGSTMFEVTQ
jgi:hypothetical protein